MPSKKIKIRLYADENFPVTSSVFLKSNGISVIHAYDLKFINKPDQKHIKEAKSLERTIITIDRDFLYYSSLATRESPGVIIISTGNATPNHINNICMKALPKISQRLAKEAFIKITTKKITIEKDAKILTIYF